ncbi:PREDICTED: C-type lectin domain family 1 member A-like [Crocodylus porosus]|uniref:C-type lectin domain family 1 member A-like n=1 Tax=Crocodylus porosus TaxID=8502 RepID=UPI00093C9EF2|nr:PREDICTED: C-type lectin domain family 1 member A-like [Crocodylus porosus]
MDDHVIAYSNMKYDHSKSQKHEDKVAQKGMTTYSELKFQKPPKKKRSARLQEAEGRGAEGSPSQLRRNQDPSVSSLRWQLTAVIFGILCLILLVAMGVLGIMVMELSQEKKDLTQCPMSCSDPNRSVPGLPPDQRPDTVMELSQEKKDLTQCPMSCSDPNRSVPGLPLDQPPDKEKCLVRWSHKEKRSYLFSSEKRPWAQCKSFCSSHSASLLWIDSQDELDFTKKESFEYSEERESSLYYYPFWTGLSYNSETKKWVWADGTALSPGLTMPLVPSHGNDAGATCVYVQGAAFKPDRCEETRFCICVKMKAAGNN